MSQKKTKNLKGRLILKALLLMQFSQVNEAKAGLGEKETNTGTPISGIISDEQNSKNQELYRKIQEAVEQAEGVLTDSKGKDLIVFLGATGAGKSTTINYLSDVDLEGITKGRIGISQNNQQSAKIGHGRNPLTSIPQLIDVTYNSNTYTLLDLPGFEDSTGLDQQVINGVLIKKILDNARSLKFVFVSKAESFGGDRRKVVKKRIDLFKEFYPSSNDIESQSIFIVTNCTDDFYVEEGFDMIGTPSTSRKPNLDGNLFGSWIEGGRAFTIDQPKQAGLIDKTKKDEILKALEKLSENKFRPEPFDISKFPGEVERHLESLFKTVMEKKFDEEFKSTSSNLSIKELEDRLELYKDNYFSKVMETEITSTLSLLKETAKEKYKKVLAELKAEKQKIINPTIEVIESRIRELKAEEARKTEAEKARLVESAEIARISAQVKFLMEENDKKEAALKALEAKALESENAQKEEIAKLEAEVKALTEATRNIKQIEDDIRVIKTVKEVHQKISEKAAHTKRNKDIKEMTKKAEELEAEYAKQEVEESKKALEKEIIEVNIALGLRHCSFPISKYQSIPSFERAANLGSAEAARMLANVYFDYGRKNIPDVMPNTETCYSKGCEWLTKAAEQGNEAAIIQLSYCYSCGSYGFEKNKNKRTEWITKAAKQGGRVAMYHLANLYLTGDDCFEKNNDKAKEWYENAAEQGNIDAMHRLGSLYLSGNYDFEKNKDKAREWLTKAGSCKAKEILKEMKEGKI